MKTKLLFIFLLCAIINLDAQSLNSSFYNRTSFSSVTPGAFRFGLYGYDNPALLNMVDNPEIYVSWMNAKNLSGYSKWSAFSAVKHLGLSYGEEKIGGRKVKDYSVALSTGNKSLAFGVCLGWSTGNTDEFYHSNFTSFGLISRPNKYISCGVSAFINQKLTDEYVAEAAFRPLGNELVSLFGDYLYKEEYYGFDNKWSAGVIVEPLAGIRFSGRYFENKTFSLGTNIGLGHFGFSMQTSYDDNNKHSGTIYGIRLGGYDRNLLSDLLNKQRYISATLTGNVKYQRYKLFDNSNTLLDLLQNIKKAKTDNNVEGIIINTSGFNTNREILWELRNELNELKKAGKKVVIYLDRAGIDLYQFASVADKIFIDPLGMITLEGFMAGKSYYKGTLEKLGIGFEEWRFFKYKSAMETYARAEMSEGDKEQLQAIVNNNYALAKDLITEGRNIPGEKFDYFVEDHPIFNADLALNYNLVDGIARFDKIGEILDKQENKHISYMGFNNIKENFLPTDNYWGEKPKIAVIYVLGICAMDEGITARKLVYDLQNAKSRSDIKAIVLRIDSPGGDALASDIIAEEMKDCKKIKPLIVSQGYVAGSGGYWLSMYADTIVAAPNTITGSIGVIGGWYYNISAKQSLGISTDLVKAGNHADLGFGMRLPFIGLSLPDRNLTSEEWGSYQQRF